MGTPATTETTSRTFRLVRDPSLAVAAWTGAAATVTAQIWAAAFSPAFDHFADLHVYWGAVQSLTRGAGLYGYAAANGDPFTYPPAAAIVMLPLAWLSESSAQVIWVVLEVAALLLLSWCVTRVVGCPPPLASGAWMPVVLLTMAVSAPVASNIHFGQVSLFVTTASAVTLLAGRSGIWAGLAAALKLTPLVLIPALLAWRRRTAVVTLATFGAATVVGWSLLPAESARYWLRDLPGGSRYGDTALAGNQSILGVLARHPTGHQTWVYLGLAAVVATFGTWRAVRYIQAGSRLAVFVIASGVALLIAPVSWTHHEIPVVLALFCVTARTPRRAWLLRACILLVMTVNLSALATLPLPGSSLLSETRVLLIAYLVLVCRYRQPAPAHARNITPAVLNRETARRPERDPPDLDAPSSELVIRTLNVRRQD